MEHSVPFGSPVFVDGDDETVGVLIHGYLNNTVTSEGAEPVDVVIAVGSLVGQVSDGVRGSLDVDLDVVYPTKRICSVHSRSIWVS